MNAAARNAKRLYDDAALLMEAGRFPTACSIAVLSIEESGKVAILRRLALAKDDTQAKKLWREYRDHRSKNMMWIVAELAAKGARTIEDLRVIVDPDSDHRSVLDSIKQLGFYTDCCGDIANWSEPNTVVEEDLARSILFAAKVLLRKKDVPVREAELWIEHLGPSIDGADSFDELVVFYRAMHAEGLESFTPEEIARFLDKPQTLAN